MRQLTLLFLLTFYLQAPGQPNKIPVSQVKMTPPKNGSPKLVVGIIVDQMRYDYIYRYWNKFGDNGFKRLVNEGFSCENTHYNYVPTYTGPGHAAVYTGTTPAHNGIISNDWYQRKTRDTMYVVSDNSVKSIGTENNYGKMSPKNLLATTITDELMYATNFRGKVFGISLKDRGAILPAGHSGTAFWFDGLTGKWITSSYYMNELPGWLKKINEMHLAESYKQSIWEPLLPLDQYTESTDDDTPYEGLYTGEIKPIFIHDFFGLNSKDFEFVRRSPFGNSFTKDIALAAIENESLGKDSITDFLAISFSATDYVGHQFGTNAIETEDTYLRLDRDLGTLLNYLDKNVGKNNFLLFLTADHAAIPNPQYLADHKFPAGYFDHKPMIDSLKKVFNSQYGEGNWIECYNDQMIYLNHDLIEKNKLNLKQVQNNVAEFCAKFDGVYGALSASQLLESEFTQGVNSFIQKGFYPKRSGDVMIFLDPGLIESYNGSKTGTTHGSPYTYDTHVPLLWYGAGISHGSTVSNIQITDIAPTLSLMLHIPFPNACTGKPIEELFKK